jgi:hypothetical protein
MSTESTATNTSTTANTVATAPQAQATAAVKKASPRAKNAAPRPVKKAAKPTVRKAPSKTQGSATQKPAPQAAKTKTVVSKPANPAQPVQPTKAKQNTEQKPKKPKLVRDSFTFPKDEYQAIAGLKQKALGLKHSAKKSEILRAGLMLLNGLNDKAFLAALSKVPALKTGRPAKS